MSVERFSHSIDTISLNQFLICFIFTVSCLLHNLCMKIRKKTLILHNGNIFNPFLGFSVICTDDKNRCKNQNEREKKFSMY